MGEELRICLLQSMGGSSEMDKKYLIGRNSLGPMYTGPLSKAGNLFIYLILGNDRLNYTITMKNSIGNLNLTTGYYNEESCLFSLQTNQSDLGPAWLWYPLQGKNLKSHPFYRRDTVSMISYYKVFDRTYDSDVMGAFAYAFTPGVWLTVALSCFVFWLMIKMYVRVWNKINPSEMIRDDSLYQVFTHLFQVGTIDLESASMKVMSLFASVFSFLAILYFTSSMNTDIVVLDEPDMINSYDNLLTKPNIRLMFSGLSDTLSMFESADPRSKERRAYERSLKNVVKPAGMEVLELTDRLRDMAFEKNRRSVAFLLHSYARAAINLACYMKVLLARSTDAAGRKKMNFYAWLSQDPDVKENIITLAYSASYKSPYLARINKRMKWVFAMGFENMLDRFIDVMPADDKMAREDGDTFRDCKADDYHQNMPQVEHHLLRCNSKYSPSPVQHSWSSLSSPLLVKSTKKGPDTPN